MPSAVVYFDRASLPIAGYGPSASAVEQPASWAAGASRLGSISGPDQVRRERQLLRARGAQLLGDGRDRALLVQRRGHHRHGQARGEQHAGDPGGLHGLLAAHGGQDDAVRRGRHGEQPGAVGAGQTRPPTGARAAPRRAAGAGRARRSARPRRRLSITAWRMRAQQRVVRAGEQRHDDGDGALGLAWPPRRRRRPARSGRCAPRRRAPAPTDRWGTRRRPRRGNRSGRRGRAARSGRCSTTSSARPRVAALGVPGTARTSAGAPSGADQGLGAAVPSRLAGSRHSYWQAGRGPSGGAHGAACYWFLGLPCSGRVQVSGIRPLLSD